MEGGVGGSVKPCPPPIFIVFFLTWSGLKNVILNRGTIWLFFFIASLGAILGKFVPNKSP